jgi:FMN-dependent NADH-azoreductase
LRQVLGFVGIHDVSFIHAEGLNLGEEFMKRGLNEAQTRLAEVI